MSRSEEGATMSDRAKPWMDTTWRVHPGGFSNLLQHTGYHLAKFGAPSEVSVGASVKLAAAAPALARALCRLEACRECCRTLPTEPHDAGCPLDAALTAAGLTTADREEVRRIDLWVGERIEGGGAT